MICVQNFRIIDASICLMLQQVKVIDRLICLLCLLLFMLNSKVTRNYCYQLNVVQKTHNIFQHTDDDISRKCKSDIQVLWSVLRGKRIRLDIINTEKFC